MYEDDLIEDTDDDDFVACTVCELEFPEEDMTIIEGEYYCPKHAANFLPDDD